MSKATTQRRFEFVANRSDKYWEIEVVGKDVIVRFGRNGTHGQTSKLNLAFLF